MTRKPKGKLMALLAVFVAIGLVTASGAFTSVQADRTVSVQVVGDGSGLIGLSAATYGALDESVGGVKSFNLDLSDETATGVNAEATTTISPIINVTNQGGETINLSVDSVTSNESSPTAPNVTNLQGVNNSGVTDFSEEVGTGETAGIGLQFTVNGNTTDIPSFNATMTINATDADGGSP